jgi:prolyl-tRNA synthetase
MLRAGLIRRVAGGLYTFLPLGLRALRKVERIVREEMNRAGALEVLMPALQPRDLWDKSHRYDIMGDVMFKLSDRQDREMVLGPTHEEVITDLVAHEINSYRQLPKTFYQIQTKFRDEIRPRFGLMRAKEFIMKDAYSFDLTMEAADTSYQKMYDAYVRIFERCGLRTKVVEADTGAMGGKWSHEFMVLADMGEDGLVECEKCSYAANLERAERSFSSPPTFPDADKPCHEVATPGMKTVEEVSRFFKCGAERLVKTLIYVADGNPIAVLVPGDRDANDRKVAHAVEATAAILADTQTVEKTTGAPIGFAGPVGLKIPIYADTSLKGYVGAITGGNKADTHLSSVSLDRDAAVTAYHDLCTAKTGDLCPKCRQPLKEMRGIEVGHVFKLGTKYSLSFDASYLDADGKKVPIVMGCYGIGVTRTLQAIIEQCHDDNGIQWPVATAPYTVAILLLNDKHDESRKAAEALAAQLEDKGIDVLLDDRDERAGVKLKDADLIGFPIRLVVSERSLSKGSIELKLRTQEKAELIPVADAVARVSALI